jgi:lipopolysaccharide assembly protein A
MAYLTWFVRIVLLLLLVGFAMKNMEPVTVSYYLNYQWQTRLVVVMFVFLLIGIAIGLLAALGTIFRLKRQIQGLKREARLQDKAIAKDRSSLKEKVS